VLLDHCLPRRLRDFLQPHSIFTTAECGWQRLRNGNLLQQASTQFDVFLTIDKRLKHEQNLATLPIVVIVVMANTNRLVDLLPFVPEILQAISTIQPRALIEIHQQKL
jgi:hypothetical protein